jgi:hypothetical protein
MVKNNTDCAEVIDDEWISCASSAWPGLWSCIEINSDIPGLNEGGPMATSDSVI